VAAYYDFFRKITLSPDGVTLEADSTQDTLTITRGNGVAFNPNAGTDSFSIDVDYSLFVPIGTTNIRLQDVNSGTHDVAITAGANMSVGRNSANELVLTSTVGGTSKAIQSITQGNPVVVTTNTQHQFTEGIAVTITDIVGMTELNGNEYYMDILTSNSFALYTDSNLTTSLNGTGFTAYGSGGVATAEYSAPQALSQLKDVDLVGTPPVNGTYLQYNGTFWQAGTTLRGDFTGSVFADDSTMIIDGVSGTVSGSVNASTLTTTNNNVTIGNLAGATSQGTNSVAVGRQAGQNTQGNSSVALGYSAGIGTQGNYAVALGSGSAYSGQGEKAIAIGYDSGLNNQGASSIAIGYNAGWSMHANSIVINATGGATGVNSAAASSFVVKPIRSATGSSMLMYDSTTGEITYGTGGFDQTLSFANPNLSISGGNTVDLSDLTPSTIAWSAVTSPPTTLTGYGITDAATSAQGALAASALQPANLGNFTFTNSILDSSDSSAITVTPYVNFDTTIATSDVVPSQNIISDLGSTTKNYRAIYAKDLMIDDSTSGEIFSSRIRIGGSDTSNRLYKGGIDNWSWGLGYMDPGNIYHNRQDTYPRWKNTAQLVQAINNASGANTCDWNLGDTWYFYHPTAAFDLDFTNVPDIANRIFNIRVFVYHNPAGTPHIPTQIKINGTSITVDWQNGVIPTASPGAIDFMQFMVWGFGSGTYVVLGQSNVYS